MCSIGNYLFKKMINKQTSNALSFLSFSRLLGHSLDTFFLLFFVSMQCVWTCSNLQKRNETKRERRIMCAIPAMPIERD